MISVCSSQNSVINIFGSSSILSQMFLNCSAASFMSSRLHLANSKLETRLVAFFTYSILLQLIGVLSSYSNVSWKQWWKACNMKHQLRTKTSSCLVKIPSVCTIILSPSKKIIKTSNSFAIKTRPKLKTEMKCLNSGWKKNTPNHPFLLVNTNVRLRPLQIFPCLIAWLECLIQSFGNIKPFLWFRNKYELVHMVWNSWIISIS